MAFEVAEKRLALAGLTVHDLFLPEVEEFAARKGRRSDPASRPSASARKNQQAIERCTRTA
jgi:hypothetical protein